MLVRVCVMGPRLRPLLDVGQVLLSVPPPFSVSGNTGSLPLLQLHCNLSEVLVLLIKRTQFLP